MLWRKNSSSLPQGTLPFPYLSTISLESLVKLNNQQKRHQSTRSQAGRGAGKRPAGSLACLASARSFSKWLTSFPFWLVNRHQRSWCCNWVFLCLALIMTEIILSGLGKILISFKCRILAWAVTLATFSKILLYSDSIHMPMSHFHQLWNTYFKLGTFLTFYWVALRCDSNPHVRFPIQLHHTFRKLVRKYSEQKLPIISSVSLWNSKNKCWEKTIKLLIWSKVRIWAGFADSKCDSIHWLFGLFWPWRPALVVATEMKNEMFISLNEKTNASCPILLQWVIPEQQKNWELPPRFSRLGVTIIGAGLNFSLEKVVLLPKLEVYTWAIKGNSGEIYLEWSFTVHCFQSLQNFFCFVFTKVCIVFNLAPCISSFWR